MPALCAVLVASALAVSARTAAAPHASAGKPRIPVVLATDIGDDIDDTWALALLLRSPELDLRLVVTDYGDTVYRARIVARLLEVAGRTDVPIGVGVRQWEKEGGQAEWVRDYPLARYPGRVIDDGVRALVDTVMASDQAMTLVAIGPPPTLRAALEKEPRLASRLRFVGMYGSLRQGYAEKSKPEPEWNVKADTQASRALLGAPWRDSLLTPLDTCGRVSLDGERYRRLLASTDPLAKAVMENYRLWCPHVDWCTKDQAATRSTTLFDTVAVYLAFAHDLVAVERLGVRVGDDGMTVPDATARPLGWATSWKDLDGFRDLLTDRLTGGAPRHAAEKPSRPTAVE
ncbi:MAG TPA: nucleoside hydrolase [Vicinamibacteria bacterium]|nr:nucleoside hydrolase [Vicinamibacteria bacterium]